MTAILDQKHYIEELNRHLSGTVTDLQAKLDSIEKTNSKLVEEVRCTLYVPFCFFSMYKSKGEIVFFIKNLQMYLNVSNFFFSSVLLSLAHSSNRQNQLSAG